MPVTAETTDNRQKRIQIAFRVRILYGPSLGSQLDYESTASSSTLRVEECGGVAIWPKGRFRIPPSPGKSVTGCAVKGGGPQRELNPSGNWFAPPGSNQSSSGGNETAEASGVEGRKGDLASVQAVT